MKVNHICGYNPDRGRKLYRAPDNRRTKNACCEIQIRPDLKSIVPREKFLDNKNNKAQLILLLAETFQRGRISVQLCSDDADASIVSAALNEATESSVEVRTHSSWLCWSIIGRTTRSSSRQLKIHLMMSQRFERHSRRGTVIPYIPT